MGNSHTKACRRYQDKSGKQYHLWLHKKNDADVIARLDAQPNKQGYIKRLVRQDISEEGKE